MAFLMCQWCPLVVTMKRVDAKAHGWTVDDVPQPSLVWPHEAIEEVWVCPRCNQRKASAA